MCCRSLRGEHRTIPPSPWQWSMKGFSIIWQLCALCRWMRCWSNVTANSVISHSSTPLARSDRRLQLALFLMSVVWFFAARALAARAAMGLSVRFNLTDERALLSVLFLLFLLALGFIFLQSIAHRSTSVSEALGL